MQEDCPCGAKLYIKWDGNESQKESVAWLQRGFRLEHSSCEKPPGRRGPSEAHSLYCLEQGITR